MESKVVRIILIALAFVVVICIVSSCKGPEKMTGKEYVEWQNKQFKPFKAPKTSKK